MAQSGYTPILIYASGTTGNTPSAANLTSSSTGAELALNYYDGKLFYKDASGNVQVLASKAGNINVSSINFGTTGLTPNTATTGAITVAGTLITSNGGTGLSSYTAGDLPYYASGTALSKLGIGTNGQILTSSGTAPQWSTLSGVAVTTFQTSLSGLTPSTATAGAVTLAGTLGTSSGGTGLTAFTANQIFYASSTSAIAQSSNLTFNGTTLTANTLNLTNALGVASGGTGLTTLTSGYIPYGNGTSAFSSSANLQFNGTNLGINVAPTSGISVYAQLQANSISYATFENTNSGTSAGSAVQVGTGTGGDLRLVAYGTNHATQAKNAFLFNANASGNLLFGTNATENMRLTTAGYLGIGTSSPSTQLHVYSSGSVGVLNQTAGSGSAYYQAKNSVGSTYLGQDSSGAYLQTDTTLPIRFYTNNTEYMRLTSAGYLGIGTSSPQANLEISQSSSGSTAQVLRLTNPNTAASTGAGIQWNLSSANSVINGEISVYRDSATSGTMVFKNAYASGGALTESMRIDSSGNLGLGVTPSAWTSTWKVLQIGYGSFAQSSASNDAPQILSNAYYTGSNYYYQINDTASRFQTNNPGFAWYIAPSGSAGTTCAFTQAMTLDNSGQLLVNQTSSSLGATTYIQSSANLASQVCAAFKDTGTTYGSSSNYIYFLNSSGSVAGGIQHTASTVVVYNATSDERLKENIVDAPNALDKVLNIPVRSYDWKEDKQHVDYGFIAQELGKIYIEPVSVGGDNEKQNPWGVDYGRLTPLLVKAIQEQQAIIESLTQRILTLENK